ncbi:MAG TPA: DUF481 domain-containing protein [Fimbriimonas sp.]|nr:DUF481 domain-containing protein [Fimbriimonas sp.]
MKSLVAAAVLCVSSAVCHAQTPAWSGTANINVNLAVSQQNSQSILLFANATKRLNTNSRLDLGMLYSFARQSSGNPRVTTTSDDRWSFTSHYDFPSSTSKYGFVDQRFERNAVNQLSLRSITTAGYGYYAIRTPGVIKNRRVGDPGDASWQITTGFSFSNESYANGLGSSHSTGVSVGSKFERILSNRMTLTHDFTFIPAFDDLTDYFLVSNLSVGVPIAGRASLNFSMINDFDSTPANGARKDNYRYALTFGYRY